MKKKFRHNKIEQCIISKKEIDTRKDNYTIILDCVGDKIIDFKFYKTEMLKDLLRGKGQVIANQLQSNIMEVTGNMLNSLGITKPVFEV